MKRLIILAALLLSVVGGLTLMSSSSPLAAQTDPSATRSFEPATVEPEGTLTVRIDIEGVALAGSVTETVPTGFTYVSTTGLPLNTEASDSGKGTLVFPFLGSSDFSYELTAPSMEGPYPFSGTLNPGPDTQPVDVGGESSVMVSLDTVPAIGNLQFDVVPAKAVKGALVSGLGKPIRGANQLEWDVTGDDTDGDDTGIDASATIVSGDNVVVGDFQIRHEGGGKFRLYVMTSDAPGLSGTQAINVPVTFDVDDDNITVNLTGVIKSRDALDITPPPGPFTIPQSIVAGTPIGAFEVSGEIEGEYLDGILTGEGSHMFAVRDGDMSLVYRDDAPEPEVGTYDLDLTVSGDAGLANRTDKVDVEIIVTASNMEPTAPDIFMETIIENLTGAGLVEAGTPVGDASAGVEANDGDSLEYSLMGDMASVFTIDLSRGTISVGSADISDTGDGGKMLDNEDFEYVFQVKVSDGITANNQYITATVTVDANSPVKLVGAAADGAISLTERVTTGAVPKTLLNLEELASDADGNTPIFTVLDSDNQTHIVHQHNADGDDLLRLTYIPTGANDLVHTVTFGVRDSWNDDGPDATFDVRVSVTELEPDPITSSFVGITVAENSTDCMQDGSMGCSLASIVPDATSFSIESGEDYKNADDNPNYAVADDGTVTVLNAPDYEDDLNPAFLVNARNNLNDLAGLISVRVTVVDVDEDPMLAAIMGTPLVYETAQVGDPVVEKPADQAGPADTDLPIMLSADDPEDAAITYSISVGKPPFAIDSSTGALTVSVTLDKEVAGSHTFTVKAADPAGNSDEMEITVHVLNANETPNFTSPTGDDAVTTIPENTGNAHVIFTFTATDEDRDDITFTLREGQSRDLFVIEDTKSAMVDGEEVWSGELHVKSGVTLDFEDAGYDPRVHVEANDPQGLNATLLLTVNLSNVNDNDPAFNVAPATSLSVPENTARGFVLANYAASDADGDSVGYSLSGSDAKSFSISDTGDLMTLESLDADRNVPCGTDGCKVTVIASDGERSATASVRITITAIEDSVSTLGVTKANPVPGTESGHPSTALAGTKTTASSAVPERPNDMPNTGAAYGVTAPVNFVEADWANWGTILRIEVIAESPAVGCGNGNQCVVIDVNSDSADTSIKLEAYRSATQENKFVAALMLVELSADATDSDTPEYAHSDGSVARIKVDEEDEIEIEFGNLRGSIDVENEDPEISNFAPDHEAAFDDADVDYTFMVTDDNSGLPEPEDLPDNDGDADYTPVVALISGGQCETADSDASAASKAHRAKLINDGFELVADMANISDDESLYCPGTAQDGEYDASGGGYGFAPIRDDKDFDDIDDGFEVETTVVLRENKTYYVTFIACDNAGNCSFYDPDGNDDAEELAQITVDTEDPVFVEARTGLTWDSTDNEYDDNRSFIQVIFNDLTNLNTATVEIDDFVVEGHTIKDVHVFENPDDDDVNWADSGRYGADGSKNKRGIDRYRDLENVVFIELEDELLADETPDVTVVPNGVEDKAGNEQDDGDHEADDWISPAFTIVSMVSTRVTSQDQILAGDDDEVTVVVTSDERLDSTRPTVTVTYVNAPSGSIDTKGIADCDDGTKAGGHRERGEIVNSDDCADNGAATGGNLNNSVEKVSNTEWIVTITEPKDTGYYNFRISGKDRSPQENPGSEGVSPGAIVTDFFDADGDVNVDDAIFFEGDINLPKPNVRVSGVSVQDNEADVEFRSPLFVELDFARNHSGNCRNVDNDERLANCMNENSEYAEDNFDDIVVTSFVLDGVDLTDSVKTTDNQSFLVSLESISIGDHTAEVQAVDQAGNVFEDTLEIDFEVNDRDPFEKRLSPGWNLVSLPGEPADSSIASVFGSGVEVRTVYSYNPVIPGGWQVAVRETLDSAWQGDLTEITGQHGYWVLSDAIQDWEVSIPRLAGGAAGTGTPIQPPVIPMYAGWNLIPVTDVSGNALDAGIPISATVYLNSLDDGLDLARVLGYDTIRNEWFTVLDMQMGSPGDLSIGSGYWVFVREAAALVPGGVAGVGGGD